MLLVYAEIGLRRLMDGAAESKGQKVGENEYFGLL
jgi:hypothetical protein